MADFGPSLSALSGAMIGNAIGSGLSNSLSQLAQQKLNQLAISNQQSQVMSNLQQLGFPEAESRFLAMMPDQQRSALLNQYLAGGGEVGNPQQQVTPQNQLASNLQGLQSEQGQQSEQPQQQIQAQPQRLSLGRAIRQGAVLNQPTVKIQQQINKDTSKYVSSINHEYKSAKNNNKRLDRMESLIDKGNLRSSTWHNFLKSVSETGGTALGVAGGILGGVLGTVLAPGPGTVAGVGTGTAIGSGIGSALGGLTRSLAETALHSPNPDSAEFEKLSYDFIRDAKAIFGNNVTNENLRAFLQTVPTLSQSDEGKRRIINNMRIVNQAALLREEAMKEIIRLNGGNRPLDLESLVEELVSPAIEDFAREFRNSIESTINSAQ